MMNNPKPISEFLVPGKRAHLVGIGGVSMCPLAEVLAGKGLLVQGSDMTESDSVKHLRSKGISVAIGHNAENLGDCDFVIRTAAVHDDNPEIAAARRLGIPVYKALREPIVRRFSEEFYRALEAAEEFLREQERRP